MQTHPCRAQRVLHQELDHVRLGVELGDGDDIRSFDLGTFLGAHLFEDAVFLFRVPVLIGPAQGILVRE